MFIVAKSEFHCFCWFNFTWIGQFTKYIDRRHEESCIWHVYYIVFVFVWEGKVEGEEGFHNKSIYLPDYILRDSITNYLICSALDWTILN